MTTPLGKQLLLYYEDPSTPGSFLLASNCKTNGMVLNNELIDITDKDGMPWRKLLEGGVQSMELSLTGVFTDSASIKQLRIWTQTNVIKNYRMVDGLGNKAQGAFQIQSMDQTGEYNKDQAFTMKFASSGVIVFTNV